MLGLLVSCLAPHLPPTVDLARETDARLLPVSAECRLADISPVGGLAHHVEQKPVTELTITPEGRMPALPLKLNLKPGFTLDGVVRYTALVEYAERGRHDSGVAAEGAADATEFVLRWDDGVRGGRCLVRLEVPWRRADRSAGVSHLCLEYRIVGENPLRERARRRLGAVEAQVIAYKESRFRQFNADGLPLFGPPRGFGLMQLDTPQPTADEVWSWHDNAEAGMRLFREKERIARGAPARARRTHPDAAEFTAEELKLETYQRYNGGAYWGWSDTLKRWVKVTRSRYADDCYALEKAVESGSPPEDWD